jgi:hypothetical protein
VVDLNTERVLVHRDPAEGAYTSLAGYATGESVVPLAAPGHALAVADLFPAE